MSLPLREEELILIYRETIRPLYAYVSRRVGGDAGLAEDLVQETWMRALDAWPGKGIPNEPLAWLQRVARNLLVSHFRRVRPEPVDATFMDRLDVEQDRTASLDADVAAVVGWGMARLRRSHAELLGAFYVDGKTVREIAMEFSLSERAVEGRLRRARSRLKKKIQRLLKPAPTSREAAVGGDTENAKPTRTP